MKMLLIENNSITRLMFEKQFRGMGHEVTACAKAETGLEAYHQTFYPLIILDLGLPEMDGFEFSRRIRAFPQSDQTMILVITAYNAADYLQTALEAGADDFLTKPVREDLLRARLTILEKQLQNLARRKQTEEDLKKAYKELEATQQELVRTKTLVALGEFAAGLAHEIRNPLANIHSSAQYCLKKERSEEQLNKHLSIILRNAERANKIIKDLLDFAKPQALSFTLSPIGEIIERACNLTEAKRSDQGVGVEKHYQEHLPAAMIDETLLEQAFINLILNALDAMQDGGMLSITVSTEGAELVITFGDTGEGIPPQDLEKIFNPFYTTKPDGVGLGLSVTHRIIQAHQGKIDVASQVQKGSKVTVRLPISGEQ